MKELYNIDELLRNKPFQELEPGEKDFVMEEVNSESEYNALRNTTLLIDNAIAQEEEIAPNPKIKESLLNQFETDNRTKVIWLNTVGAWLVPSGKRVYQMPVAQIAATIAIVIGATFTFNLLTETQENDMVAQNLTEETTSEEIAPESNAEENTEVNNEYNTTVVDDEVNNENDIDDGLVAEQANVADNAETPVVTATVSGGATGASFSWIADEVEPAEEAEHWNDNSDVADMEFDATITDGTTADWNSDSRSSVDAVTYTNVDLFTSSTSAEDKGRDLPTQGASLGDNTELLSLLFSTL